MNKADKLNINFQVKSNKATFKELDESLRTITAIVNTYNYFDYDEDVLVPGCAKRSIEQRGSKSSASDKILHALFHDLNRLPGKSMEEMETTHESKNVLMCSSFLPETTEGENTLINYKSDIYNQHSIGFKYLDLEYLAKESEEFDKVLNTLINPEDAIKAEGLWLVKEIEWFEWSTVAFGANKLTPYLGVKSTNKNVQLNNLYTKLDTLIKQSKKGIKQKKIFELQYLQVKQMIKEVLFQEPSIKDTLIKGTSDVETQSKTRRRQSLIIY